MPENKIEWVYKCGSEWKYCKDGLCERYNQLKEIHKNPAIEMSKEWLEITGKEWKAKQITTTFIRLLRTNVRNCEPCEEVVKKKRKMDQELMWLSVERRLVETLKFIERNFDPPVKTSNGTKTEILGNLKLIKMYFD